MSILYGGKECRNNRRAQATMKKVYQVSRLLLLSQKDINIFIDGMDNIVIGFGDLINSRLKRSRIDGVHVKWSFEILGLLYFVCFRDEGLVKTVVLGRDNADSAEVI